MKAKQGGFVNFGSMTLIVGGVALFGLLFYGLLSGQQLPLWPALAVVALNLFGAYQLIMEKKKLKEGGGAAPAGAALQDKAHGKKQ